MRVVRGSGVRCGLLPKSFAPQMSLEPRRVTRLSGVLHGTMRKLFERCSLGICRLSRGSGGRALPSLLLARVDGTSPVEYITQTNDQILVRRFAMPFILKPVSRLDELRSRWAIACAAK